MDRPFKMEYNYEVTIESDGAKLTSQEVTNILTKALQAKTAIPGLGLRRNGYRVTVTSENADG